MHSRSQQIEEIRPDKECFLEEEEEEAEEGGRRGEKGEDACGKGNSDSACC